jgi:hypothetical protein
LAALILQAARVKQIDLDAPGPDGATGSRRGYAVKGIIRAAAKVLDGYNQNEQGAGLPAWAQIDQILADLAAGTKTIDQFLSP